MLFLPDSTTYTILPARNAGHAPPVWVNGVDRSPDSPAGNILLTHNAVQLLARRMSKDHPPALVLGCAILLHFSNGNAALADQLADDFFREWIEPNALRVAKISGKDLYRWIIKRTMKNPVPGREQWAKPLSAQLTADELAALQRSHDVVEDILREGGAR